jgi:serine/threonine-protein kinase
MVLSALGLMKGRMGYLAPEVMQQEPADQRADVFSTGVVLWECLTGRRLFKGKTDEEVITAVLTREVPPPQTLEPGVPEALGAAVLRALARKPADRFQTAAELEQALLASLAGTTPRVMSQALAKLVSQFVPIATPQQLAELPRPEEPAEQDEPIDIQDAASAPSGGEEPANWSMFNESFEKPLMADGEEQPGATTVMAAPPTQLLQSPPLDPGTAIPTLPRARLNARADPTQDLPPTAVHVELDPETAPGVDVEVEAPAATGFLPDTGEGPLVTPTPWDDVKVTSSSGL